MRENMFTWNTFKGYHFGKSYLEVIQKIAPYESGIFYEGFLNFIKENYTGKKYIIDIANIPIKNFGIPKANHIIFGYGNVVKFVNSEEQRQDILNYILKTIKPQYPHKLFFK